MPGGNLDDTDRLGLSTGAVREAKNAFYGPVEWAYLADAEGDSALFLIQHTPDSLDEEYLVADQDSSMFKFGSGQMTATPVRFSLGLVPSSAAATIAERVAFVQEVTP